MGIAGHSALGHGRAEDHGRPDDASSHSPGDGDDASLTGIPGRVEKARDRRRARDDDRERRRDRRGHRPPRPGDASAESGEDGTLSAYGALPRRRKRDDRKRGGASSRVRRGGGAGGGGSSRYGASERSAYDDDARRANPYAAPPSLVGSRLAGEASARNRRRHRAHKAAPSAYASSAAPRPLPADGRGSRLIHPLGGLREGDAPGGLEHSPSGLVAAERIDEEWPAEGEVPPSFPHDEALLGLDLEITGVRHERRSARAAGRQPVPEKPLGIGNLRSKLALRRESAPAVPHAAASRAADEPPDAGAGAAAARKARADADGVRVPDDADPPAAAALRAPLGDANTRANAPSATDAPPAAALAADRLPEPDAIDALFTVSGNSGVPTGA